MPGGQSAHLYSIVSASEMFAKALELEANGKTQDALVAYKQVVEICPEHHPSLVNIGTIYVGCGNLEMAASYYKAAIIANGEYALAYFNLGNVFDEMGFHELAAALYREALNVVPNYPDAHYNLALTLQQCGHIMQAIRHWKMYLRFDSNSRYASYASYQLAELKRLVICG